ADELRIQPARRGAEGESFASDFPRVRERDERARASDRETAIRGELASGEGVSLPRAAASLQPTRAPADDRAGAQDLRDRDGAAPAGAARPGGGGSRRDPRIWRRAGGRGPGGDTQARAV